MALIASTHCEFCLSMKLRAGILDVIRRNKVSAINAPSLDALTNNMLTKLVYIAFWSFTRNYWGMLHVWLKGNIEHALLWSEGKYSTLYIL